MKTALLILLASCVGALAQFKVGTPPFVGQVRPRSGNANSLDDVTAYWKLDETTGNNRADSGPNGQTLTDTGSVPAGTGKINNAINTDTTAESSTLTHADSATLSLGADTPFTVSAWVNIESVPVFPFPILDKTDGISVDAGWEYGFRIETSQNQFALTVGNGVTTGEIRASTFGTIGAGQLATWIFVVAWYDNVAQKLRIQVNDGTVDETAWTGGTQNGANQLALGSSASNANVRFDGLIDEVGFWKRVLSSGERTSLYNAGAGITCCPFPP